MKKWLLFLAPVAIFLACMYLWLLGGVAAWVMACHLEPSLARDQCSASKPPPGFERDLAGTWQYGFPSYSDTLVIRDDRTYQQSIHRDANGYSGAVDYQSAWQPWWIEYNGDGIPYLHLSGMHLCQARAEKDCTTSGGSGYDFCSQRFVPMKYEGILLILSRSPTINPPSPKVLLLIFPMGDANSQVYTKANR